jgi:GPI ethanolamine phosphate transferase 1
VTRSSALSLQAKQGLPRGNQAVGWFVLGNLLPSRDNLYKPLIFSVVSLLMPMAYRIQPHNHYIHRLIVMFLTCAPTFVILTISYETLFYVAFCSVIFLWIHLEHQVYLQSLRVNEPKSEMSNGRVVQNSTDTVMLTYRPLTLSDARIALFFFALLQSSYFSTGNIASISSFSLESVCRLLPVFDPFSQAALLILKIMIPFALLSANLGILNKKLGVKPSALFMLVMAISDILTLYFFWVVKDEGSWLEIGSTITHFAIASFLCVFVAALEGVSSFFISGVEVERPGVSTQNGTAYEVPLESKTK